MSSRKPTQRSGKSAGIHAVRGSGSQLARHHSRESAQPQTLRATARPQVAYRQRGHIGLERHSAFYAQEDWHDATEDGETRIFQQAPGAGFMHPVSVQDVRERLKLIPPQFTERLEVVQLSRMTRKRSLFPAYGMQWGPNVYLYPIEASLIETYTRPPTPQQLVEAKMFGAQWTQNGNEWQLTWTRQQLQDFYLNNVLIHEVGHVNDERNTNSDDRERFANWFAIEYGYRQSRGRR